MGALGVACWNAAACPDVFDSSIAIRKRHAAVDAQRLKSTAVCVSITVSDKLLIRVVIVYLASSR